MKTKHIIGLGYHFLIKKPKVWWSTRRQRTSPKDYISDVFKTMGRTMNWDNPQTLDEKIQWLKFNSDTSQWALLSDKYRVREYVRQCGLEDLLVPLIAKWDKVRDIDWVKLPSAFIMKTNHGSADAMLCMDKTNINISAWKYHFILALYRKYGINNCEFHYSKIKPCIIAEELLDATKQSIASSSLIDYKVWCINGLPQCIWTYHDRTDKQVQVMMYDTQWNACPDKCTNSPHCNIAKVLLPKPKSLSKMLEAARILSNGFPVVRVDFYEVDNKLYFGEMTFTASGGFHTSHSKEFQEEMGKLIDLNLCTMI